MKMERLNGEGSAVIRSSNGGGMENHESFKRTQPTQLFLAFFFLPHAVSQSSICMFPIPEINHQFRVILRFLRRLLLLGLAYDPDADFCKNNPRKFSRFPPNNLSRLRFMADIKQGFHHHALLWMWSGAIQILLRSPNEYLCRTLSSALPSTTT